MKIRDIAELTAVLLQKHDLLAGGVFNGEPQDDFVKNQLADNRELRLLIRCVNLVLKEVACDYIQLIHRQTMTAVEGKIDYGDFEKTLLEIKSVKNLNGEDVRYFALPDYVAVEDGVFEVSYAFVPQDKGFFDDVDFGGTKAGDRVFAYGAAAEFCLISGNYDEALMWERRYKDALTVATRKTTEVIMPRRRWW